MKYNKEFFTADFETTVCSNPLVYSWGLFSNNFWEYGIDIKSFLKRVLKFKNSAIIYFHNGSKFDFKFILPILTEIGLNERPYTNSKKIIRTLKESNWKLDHIGERGKLLETNEFEYFADGTKKIYNIKIGLKSKNHHKKVNTIEFRDSNLLFTGSIASYGDSLNKHFKTNIYSKGGTGKITYDKKVLYKDVKELENDGNELKYLKQDCKIAYDFLNLMKNDLPMKWWKLTAAGTAFNYWKSMFGKQLLEQALKDKKIQKVILNKKNGYYEIKERNSKKLKDTRKWKNKEILKYFPTKWLDESDDDDIPISITVNQYYNGGLTWMNPRFKGLKLKNIRVYDEVSAYPSVMSSNKLLPYGTPVMGDGGKDYPCKLINIWTITDCYNKKGLPFIFSQGKGSDMTKIYAKKLPANNLFKMTDVEYERFKKYYTGEYEKEVYMSFNGIEGNFFFGNYIDKFFKMKAKGKAEGNAAKTTIAKLFLNALYGKFGTKTTRDGRIYNFDNNDWESTKYIEKAGFYLPIAIYITALNRMNLVDAIDENNINTIGGDTDSTFILYNESFKKFKFKLHPSKLGYWNMEFEGSGVFKRSKQYLLHKGKIVTAGINWKREYDYIDEMKSNFENENININLLLDIANEIKILESNLPTINNFCNGIYASNQLSPIQFTSGIQLVKTRKELKAIWKDTPHSEDWYFNGETYAKNYTKQFSKVMKQET